MSWIGEIGEFAKFKDWPRMTRRLDVRESNGPEQDLRLIILVGDC
jgi:hypothetical protein